MNCDKEYEYEVRDVLIVKVDSETGEEVLNRDGSIKYFRAKEKNDYAGYSLMFHESEVEEV